MRTVAGYFLLMWLITLHVLPVETSVPFELHPPKGPVPQLFFGIHVHRAGDATPWPPFPVYAWRLWDSEVSWSSLQPTPQLWNFSLLDRYVQLASQHHTEILLTLGHTPKWAASRPDEISVSGHPGAASFPADLSLWSEYVRTVGLRYKGKIHVYEIWNEPNMPGSYSGTMPQMITLAREAYTILKEIDSTNIVVSPSGARGGRDLQWLEDFLLQQGDRYCDVIGYHFYVTPSAPESMVPVIAQVKEMLHRHGVEKPLWNTESGWARGKNFSNDEERMGYLARSYILAWALGVERFYWYAYDNYQWATLPLTLPDRHTLNSAGLAYQTLESWLVNARIEKCIKDREEAWSCSVFLAGGSHAWIVWSANSVRSSQIQIHCCPPARIHYLDGRIETQNIAGGVHVGPAPVLVESLTAPN